jgi:hypothetical protein
VTGTVFCRWTPIVLGFALTLVASAAALAQGLRDPTLPPATATADVPGDASPKVATVAPGAVAVLVRDGVPYLVVGTRLFVKGQKFEQARIERITETEVWLREDGTLRKMPVFSGIQRQVHTLPAVVEKPLRPARKKADEKKPRGLHP